MNDHLKAHRDFQQVMDDSLSKLRETFQTWLQQRQEQVVNLDTYTPEPSQCRKIPIYYDDDDDEYSFATQEYLKKFSSAITPDFPKLDSLIMEDNHLGTIPKTESDELIKSSVEDLDKVLDDIISIPPGNGNEHFNAESSLIESVLNRDNMISSPKIDFLLEEFTGELTLIAPIPSGIVEADFDLKGDIRFIENLMYDNSFPRPPKTLKDDFKTVIDSNNDYYLSDDDSPYSEDIDYVDALPPDPELVSLEVPSSGSTTTHADISLLEYDSFHLDSEPDSGDFTMDVVEDILIIQQENQDDSLGSELVVSFPFGSKNKIFDPGIFIGVQSKRFLSLDKFSISFICDPSFPVIDTLLPFSSENEDKVVNPGILAAGGEKYPHLLSHQGFKAFQLISESPILIHGENIPILDVPFLHFYPL
ncbi:hypothetical protein Tco_1010130 [Tanacetum coccineum]